MFKPSNYAYVDHAYVSQATPFAEGGRVWSSLVPQLLVGREKKNLVSLIVHMRNYSLLNMCSGDSGRGTLIHIYMIDSVTYSTTQ